MRLPLPFDQSADQKRSLRRTVLDDQHPWLLAPTILLFGGRLNHARLAKHVWYGLLLGHYRLVYHHSDSVLREQSRDAEPEVLDCLPDFPLLLRVHLARDILKKRKSQI